MWLLLFRPKCTEVRMACHHGIPTVDLHLRHCLGSMCQAVVSIIHTIAISSHLKLFAVLYVVKALPADPAEPISANVSVSRPGRNFASTYE